MKVAENLYFHAWESMSANNCNTIVLTGESTTLIDPGHAQFLPGLKKRLAEDGIDITSIDLVINTHSHPDHFEGSQVLAELGAKVAMHAEGEAFLEKVGPAFFQALGGTMPELTIDLHLVEGELTISGHPAQVYHTPGHSPGSVCIYLADSKTLISGDLVFAQGVGRTDFPGGSGQTLKSSIERMSQLDIELLLPGHGPAVAGARNVAANFQIIKQMYFGML